VAFRGSRIGAIALVAIVVPTAVLAAAPAPVPYRLVSPAKALTGRTSAEIALLERLNRADRRHLWRLKTVVLPDDWRDGATAHAPFPLVWSWAIRYPKALAVSLPGQAFAAYEHGVLVHWGPLSSGRRGAETPSGLHYLNWRSRGRHSTVDEEWYMPWYFNFRNRGGVAFHEFALPGLPASHACVRLLHRDARWLFDWGEEWKIDSSGRVVFQKGTPVVLVDDYDFGAPPPWRSVDWLADGVALPVVVDGEWD